MTDTIRCTGTNLTKMRDIFSLCVAVGLPYVIGADWNMVPGELEACPVFQRFPKACFDHEKTLLAHSTRRVAFRHEGPIVTTYFLP